MPAYDPFPDDDPEGDAEWSEKRREALEHVAGLIDAGLIDAARRELAAIAHNDATRAAKVEAQDPPEALTLDGLRTRLNAKEARSPLPGVTLFEAAKLPLPPPVLKRRYGTGAVLVEGETCLLTGEGKSGKSTVALQLAMAGVAAMQSGAEWGTSCGIDVRPGQAIIATWEDRAAVLGMRAAGLARHARKTTGGDTFGVWRAGSNAVEVPSVDALQAALDGVHVLDMRPHGPIFAPPSNDFGQALTNALPRPSAAFDRLWLAVDEWAPDGDALVIVDPALKAFAGEPNAAVPVQAFLSALGSAAAERGAAVLLVHHSNKAARKETGQTADMASGAAAWTDGARGVLGMLPANKEEGLPPRIKCLAANYGPARWTEYQERIGSDRAGWQWKPDTSGNGAAKPKGGESFAAPGEV